MLFPTASISEGKRCPVFDTCDYKFTEPLMFLLLLLFLFRKSYSLEPNRSFLSGETSRCRELATPSTANLIPPRGWRVRAPQGSQGQRQHPIHAETPEPGPWTGAGELDHPFLLGKCTHTHTPCTHTRMHTPALSGTRGLPGTDSTGQMGSGAAGSVPRGDPACGHPGPWRPSSLSASGRRAEGAPRAAQGCPALAQPSLRATSRAPAAAPRSHPLPKSVCPGELCHKKYQIGRFKQQMFTFFLSERLHGRDRDPRWGSPGASVPDVWTAVFRALPRTSLRACVLISPDKDTAQTDEATLVTSCHLGHLLNGPVSSKSHWVRASPCEFGGHIIQPITSSFLFP